MSPALDTRTFAALGFADEICARPALLAMFAESLGAGADATLVLAAGQDSDLEERVIAAAAAVGLAADRLPDLLLLPLGEVRCRGRARRPSG